MAEVAPKGITRDQRWSLEGQTALVTGGTKGIGHAIVEELVGFGAIVHTCARNKSDLDRCLEEWKSKGFRVTGSVCDVSQRDQREKLVETVSSLFNGKLNILVNNAGIVIPKLATEFTVEDVSILFATNFESGFGFCQALHPLLKASGNGSIVFNSSVASVMALPYLSVYGATKGAINQLTRSLACEWAKDNIRINSIAPGATKTDMLSNYSSNIRDEDQVYDGRTPLNRLGEPNEIWSVVTFLCLPAAAYITGQVICIDGGFNVNGLPSSQ